MRYIDNKFDQMNLICCAIFIFVMDQFSKIVALQTLTYDREIPVNAFMSFHRIFNQNTFMLNYTLPIPIWTYKLLWILVALILIIGIFWVVNQQAFKENSLEAELGRSGLFIILGGCLGNAFDVIFRYDGVVDFIRLNFVESIPIINIADIMIYVGELFLIISWTIILYKLISNKFRSNIKRLFHNSNSENN